jgi:multimeric flavodoxin WrbA
MDSRNIKSYKKKFHSTINFLKKKKKVLFITTSNRWSGDKEKPKSTKLAYELKKYLKNATIIEVPKLNIFNCEGNVSTRKGNKCGEKSAKLKDKRKNPSGFHRCWASINNPKDELWKISKPLFESDCVIFFGSIRWGQANAYYQKLIERLTWIENMHSTLGEKNIISDIDAGVIFIGQNWNGKNVISTQKKVLKYYGFKTPRTISWNWQYTSKINDETNESYKNSYLRFKDTFIE